MIATALASIARPLWRLLEHYRVDPALLFREVGLDPALMHEPRGRYKVERTLAAWQKAADLIEDPCFALKVAELWHPPDLHALGYAFLASSTLRSALDRVVRYMAIVNDRVRFRVEEKSEHVICTFDYLDPGLEMPASVEDARWALFLSLCRQSYGESLNPAGVRFQHSRPLCPGDYYELFRCPILFGCETSAVSFARCDVYRPLPAANRELARANDRILANFLKELTEDDLVTKVKKAIAEELPSGSPKDDLIAKSMFMSARNLHRKLSAVGANYSALLDAVRRELAEQYIGDPTLSLGEISFLLGFSEQSAFSRAFRRWTGKAPSTFRDAAPP
ncbi:MAG: AraC family transcriptional regulator [Chromatiaceae bacterium]|nr:AraC family transcriptional regulator [Chromatiaceae bacterium]